MKGIPRCIEHIIQDSHAPAAGFGLAGLEAHDLVNSVNSSWKNIKKIDTNINRYPAAINNQCVIVTSILSSLPVTLYLNNRRLLYTWASPNEFYAPCAPLYSSDSKPQLQMYFCYLKGQNALSISNQRHSWASTFRFSYSKSGTGLDLFIPVPDCLIVTFGGWNVVSNDLKGYTVEFKTFLLWF